MTLLSCKSSGLDFIDLYTEVITIFAFLKRLHCIKLIERYSWQRNKVVGSPRFSAILYCCSEIFPAVFACDIRNYFTNVRPTFDKMKKKLTQFRN